MLLISRGLGVRVPTHPAESSSLRSHIRVSYLADALTWPILALCVLTKYAQ